jgi:hypothetical protein
MIGARVPTELDLENALTIDDDTFEGSTLEMPFLKCRHRSMYIAIVMCVVRWWFLPTFRAFVALVRGKLSSAAGTRLLVKPI